MKTTIWLFAILATLVTGVAASAIDQAEDDRQAESAPGTKYAYWDSAMNQFAHVLTRVADGPIKELLKGRIADAIGMNQEKWNWGDLGEIDGVVVNGGSGNGNKHVFICAREMARLDHLMLNRGKWNDRRLLSEAWVDAATSIQVPASMPLGDPIDRGIRGAKFPIDGRGAYGFNWWVNGHKADGKRKWPGAPAGTFAASDYNNNMFVVPEWNMIIVRLGLDERSFRITDQVCGTFLSKVGDAIPRQADQDYGDDR